MKRQTIDEIINDLKARNMVEVPEINIEKAQGEPMPEGELIHQKLDDLMGLAQKLGLDLIIVARDLANREIASQASVTHFQDNEDGFSVCCGLLESLVSMVVGDNPHFIVPVLRAVQDFPGIFNKIQETDKPTKTDKDHEEEND